MEIHEIKLDGMDMSFERFRLVDPQADARMIASIKTYGQLSPVFTGRIEKKLLLIDGYKRFRAAKALQWESLQAYTVERSIMVLKAMSLTINQERSPCRELEEALLLQSLHHDDGLQQNEIALLCNRHKSWVCRRIALIERLSEEVQKQLRLGLISISVARELLRLPRANQQQEVLQSVLDNHLSSRKCRHVVDVYLTIPEWQRQKLLENPQQHTTSEQWKIDCGCFTGLIVGLLRCSYKLAVLLREKGIGLLNEEQRNHLHKSLERVCIQCSSIFDLVKTKAGAQ
jgi:ParB/RepB/Spo0J family partition protein